MGLANGKRERVESNERVTGHAIAKVIPHLEATGVQETSCLAQKAMEESLALR